MSRSTHDFADLSYANKVNIDTICDEYESRIRGGRPTNVADYVSAADTAIRPALVRELLAIDLADRSESRATIRAEYLSAFPQLRSAIESNPPSAVPLQEGDLLGSYRIVRPIGRGGMGVVYEARDEALGRTVALKFLNREISDNRDRITRFRREAKILAGLNHPNIATLHSFEEHDCHPFCVLEYVPGSTLSEMIRGGRLSIPEAISIFSQIADALESAHESGVIHRDLKPANIKITDAGLVKVLDFGLATTADAVGQLRIGDTQILDSQEGENFHTAARLPNSERTALAGTLPYMSPEQLDGKKVDKRSDIWSFGCCLYETLTGRRVFRHETCEEIVSSITSRDPDWPTLPRGTPPELLSLIRKCLTRNPRQRLRDIGDARITLQDLQRESQNSSRSSRKSSFGRNWSLLAACAAWILAMFVGLSEWRREDPGPQLPESQTSVNLPAGLRLAGQMPEHSLALSPDGNKLVFAAIDESGEQYLYVRDKARFNVSKLANTQGATGPFFSPDGNKIVFFTQDSVKTISPAGGTATTVCHAQGPIRGGCWTSRNTILFAWNWGSVVDEVGPDGSRRTRLHGKASFPQLLPCGTLLLNNEGQILTLETDSTSQPVNQLNRLVPGADCVRYTSGHLVYSDGGSLFSVPVDWNPPRLLGKARLLAETEYDALNFAVSSSGDIAYAPAESFQSNLLWQNRNGTTALAWPEKRRYGSFRLSPNGTKLAIGVYEDDGWRVSIYDFQTGAASLLLNEGAVERPVWTPNGKHIICRRTTNGRSAVHFVEPGGGSSKLLSVSGAGPSADQTSSPSSVFESPQGLKLIYYHFLRGTDRLSDIHEYNIDTGHDKPLINSTDEEAFGQLSPDGQWLLYLSTRATRNYEAFITRYPTFDVTHRVSVSGALDPIWGPTTDTIYYRGGKSMRQIMKATLEFTPFRVSVEPVVNDTADCSGYSFDYDARNDRFLFLRTDDAPTSQTGIRWLQNSLTIR